jgi:hypothetical protein
MPLARILTRFPEQARALSEELRHHGYTVEFSSPERAGKAPADLEIDFEICAETDALSRATDLAEQLHADLAVSAGVVGHEEQGAVAPETSVAAEIFPPEPANSISQQTMAAEEPGRASASEPLAEQEPGREEEDQSFVPEAVAQSIAEPALARDIAPEIVPDTPEYSAQSREAATPFDDELEIARVAAEDKAEFEHREEVAEPVVASSPTSERAREFVADAGKKSAAALQRAAVTVGELWAAGRESAEQFWEAARQRAREYHERAQIGRAERRAERQQKLLELEKRRAMAQERAAELEAAREAAAARLQELLRERGALTAAQPAPPPVAAAATSSPAKAGVFSRGWLAGKVRFSLPSTHLPQVQAVLMGVAAACLLFVVGLAVGSFHARPAISSSLNRPSPNGVTVQSGGVTVQAGAPAAPAASSTAAPPAAVARTRPPAKPAPAVRQRSSASDVTIRNFPAARPSPRHAGAADRVADDVTIRHFGAQPSPPAQSAPRAQLRHYSDLDN